MSDSKTRLHNQMSEEIPNTPPEGLGYWDDHPDFPVENCPYATRGEYWQWINSQLTKG